MAIDPNKESARIVRESTQSEDRLPADVEAAWEARIKGIQRVDERAKTVLRAAFEAGYGAASKPAIRP